MFMHKREYFGRLEIGIVSSLYGRHGGWDRGIGGGRSNLQSRCLVRAENGCLTPITKRHHPRVFDLSSVNSQALLITMGFLLAKGHPAAVSRETIGKHGGAIGTIYGNRGQLGATSRTKQGPTVGRLGLRPGLDLTMGANSRTICRALGKGVQHVVAINTGSPVVAVQQAAQTFSLLAVPILKGGSNTNDGSPSTKIIPIHTTGFNMPANNPHTGAIQAGEQAHTKAHKQTQKHTKAHKQVQASTHKHKSTQTNTNAHTSAQASTNAHKQTQTHTQTHKHKHTQTHTGPMGTPSAHMHTCAHKHTQITVNINSLLTGRAKNQANTHTCTQGNTLAHMYSQRCSRQQVTEPTALPIANQRGKNKTTTGHVIIACKPHERRGREHCAGMYSETLLGDAMERDVIMLGGEANTINPPPLTTPKKKPIRLPGG